MAGIWLVSYVALWVLFIVISLVVLSILHNLGVIYRSLETHAPGMTAAPSKLENGVPLPDITLHTVENKKIRVSSLSGDKSAFFVVSPTCSPCHDLLHAVIDGHIGFDPKDDSVRRGVIISLGSVQQTAEMSRALGLADKFLVLADTGGAVEKNWGTTSTPTTIIADGDLRVVRHIFGAPATHVVPDDSSALTAVPYTG